jgi:hypothetical protein
MDSLYASVSVTAYACADQCTPYLLAGGSLLYLNNDSHDISNQHCTGCSVTTCSALSQASCRSPDDRRGAALPQKDVGGHVGVNHI